MPGFSKVADKHLVIGQVYRLVEHEERSQASHNHLFAIIDDVWETLPDHLRMAQFPNRESLRKHALIRAGHCDMIQVTSGSRAEAERLAVFARRLDDGYALVSIEGTVVSAFTAKSISYRSLPRREFQAVKDSVLAFLSELIGTTPETLSANAGQAA